MTESKLEASIQVLSLRFNGRRELVPLFSIIFLNKYYPALREKSKHPRMTIENLKFFITTQIIGRFLTIFKSFIRLKRSSKRKTNTKPTIIRFFLTNLYVFYVISFRTPFILSSFRV
jgi:hypothetical protein